MHDAASQAGNSSEMSSIVAPLCRDPGPAGASAPNRCAVAAKLPHATVEQALRCCCRMLLR